MSLSSSMNAGVSGLRANATRLGTISDNIANSATYGYRRAHTSFHSLVVGTGVAGQGSYSAGGVRATTVRLVDQGGSLIGTQNSTDLAISGRGFLPVTSELGGHLQDGSAPLLLSTTGSFRQDQDGILRDSAGHALLGWPANPDGSIPAYPRDSANGLRPIQIGVNQQAYSPTTSISLGINLPATQTSAGAAGAESSIMLRYYDTLGRENEFLVTFSPQTDPLVATNTWSMSLTDPVTGDLIGTYELVFDTSPALGGTLSAVNHTSAVGLDYDSTTGNIPLTLGGEQIDLFIGTIGSGSAITQRGSDFSPTGVSQDGFGTGNLVGLMVDANGNLDAVYDQGFRRTLYRIPVVDVPNPNGLTTMDNQAFRISRDSGAFFLWDAGDGPTGAIQGFTLQESATDIANELTGLIQTQRAYSSNAKVIQTVDEMFQETTNIKR